MHRIRYDQELLLVGDEAVGALMDLASHLMSRQQCMVVRFAALHQTGEPTEAMVLLGPATMISAVRVDARYDEPDNTTLLAMIANRLAPPRTSSTVEFDHHVDDFGDFDEYPLS